MSALYFLRRAVQWAVSVELWVIAALAAACVVSESLLLPAVIVAALIWPLRWLAHGRLSVHSPFDWPAGLMALMLPVSLLATPLPEVTLPQVYRLLVGMALCYAIINHPWSLVGLLRTLVGLVGLGVGLSVVALVSVNWFVEKLALIPVGQLQDLPGLMGEQVHPNVMAGMIVLLALFGPSWLLFGGRQTRWWGTILLLLATALPFAVLVFTKSRGAWLGLAAGLAVLVILCWPRWGSVAVMVISLIGGVFLVSHADLVQELIIGNGGVMNVSSLQGREEIWTRAVSQIKEFPLTGIGMGTFPQVSLALFPFFNLSAGNVPHAHNLYLQIAVDLGLPGLAAWIMMAYVVVRIAWQVYRAGLRKVGWLAGLGAGLIASQTTLAVHGLVDAVTWGNRPAVLVWGIWGLAVASWVFVRGDSLVDKPGI